MAPAVKTFLRTEHATDGVDEDSHIFQDSSKRKIFINDLVEEYVQNLKDWVAVQESKEEYQQLTSNQRTDAYMQNSRATIAGLKDYFSNCKMIGTIEDPDQVVVANMWTKFFLNPWFGGLVVFAFAGVISLIHSASYSAEVHKSQTLWIIIGVMSLLAAIFCLRKVSGTSTGKGG